MSIVTSLLIVSNLLCSLVVAQLSNAMKLVITGIIIVRVGFFYDGLYLSKRAILCSLAQLLVKYGLELVGKCRK